MSKNMPFWLCQVEVVSVMIAMNVIEELTVDEQEEVVDVTNARGIVTQGLSQ